MKTSAPKTVNGITYSRVEFRAINAGDELYQMDSFEGGTPVLLGVVSDIETTPHGTTGVNLDCGKRLTARGWQSKRIWKKI